MAATFPQTRRALTRIGLGHLLTLPTVTVSGELDAAGRAHVRYRRACVPANLTPGPVDLVAADVDPCPDCGDGLTGGRPWITLRHLVTLHQVTTKIGKVAAKGEADATQVRRYTDELTRAVGHVRDLPGDLDPAIHAAARELLAAAPAAYTHLETLRGGTTALTTALATVRDDVAPGRWAQVTTLDETPTLAIVWHPRSLPNRVREVVAVFTRTTYPYAALVLLPRYALDWIHLNSAGGSGGVPVQLVADHNLTDDLIDAVSQAWDSSGQTPLSDLATCVHALRAAAS